MNWPRRIILSRKGFDSSAGRCASPILDGLMFSLPIPQKPTYPGGTRYRDLGNQGRLSVPKNLITSSGRNVHFSEQAHLDPDIRPALRPQGARTKCLPGLLLFGQDGGSQTHLKDHGVEEGDLFLFFGWYREAEISAHDIQFLRRACDQHLIWGWLQVGERHDIPLRGELPAKLSSALHHPHLGYRDRKNNCVYQAARSLSFNSKLRGAGIFNPLDPVLRLTAPEERRRSYWMLPEFFATNSPTHLNCGDWERREDMIYGRSPGRGQEFVFDTELVKAQARSWLTELFKHAEKRN